MSGDIKIATFGTNHEAELARLYLDENGFDVRIEDDLLVGAALPWETALGGIKLFVPVDQAEDATALIEEFRTQAKQDRRPEAPTTAISRAFRVAIVGLFLCPGPAHLWSLAIVLNTPSRDLPAAPLRTLRLTLALDLVVIAVTAKVLLTALMAPPEPPRQPPPQPVVFGHAHQNSALGLVSA